MKNQFPFMISFSYFISLIIMTILEKCSCQSDIKNIIALDLGNDFIKASFYENEKFITMIENFQSNTKTANAIAFKGEERYYGSDATSKYAKSPDNVLIKLNRFLGFDVSNFDINNIYNINHLIPDNLMSDYNALVEENKLNYLRQNNILNNIFIDGERNSLNFLFNFDEMDKLNNDLNAIFSLEEIYAMIFRYIQSFSSKYLERDISEFLIAIPSFFTYMQRMSLIQASNIASIKINNLISSSLASGLYYALEKSFVNKDKNYVAYSIIFDIGSSYTQASLFSYNSYIKNENKKTIELTNMRKIYETWDNSLGGKYFDIIIAEILAEKYKNELQFSGKNSTFFQKRYNPNNIDNNKEGQYSLHYRTFVTKNEYANENEIEKLLIAKFLFPANKIKEILSANKEHRFNLIVDNGNFIGNITRKEFEEKSEDLFQRVHQPIERLLEYTNKHMNEIESIQIIGGGIRIPKIREILQEKFGQKKVLTNLNGDNTIAMGAAFYYTNKTLNNFIYKNKKILSTNKYPFNGDLKIRVKNLYEEVDRSNLSGLDISSLIINNKIKAEAEAQNCEEKNMVNEKVAENITKENELDEYAEENFYSQTLIDRECLDKVDEERTIFAKDFNRENFKILKFNNKIQSNLIIEIYESFKENKYQSELFISEDLTIKDNLNPELRELLQRKLLNNKNNKLDLIGVYTVHNIANYIKSIKSEISENLVDYTDVHNSIVINKSNNTLNDASITMNLIVTVDSLGMINLKGEFEYEILYFLNYEKTRGGQYRFFYTTKYMPKLDNKTLTEEFNYINTHDNFKSYSKNEKISLKKKLKYEIGANKKSEIKKKEILLDYFPSQFPFSMNKKQITKSRIKLNSLDLKDENKRKVGESLNNLENLIYTKFDFFKNIEKKNFYSAEEEKTILSILTQIKEEMFENDNDGINPLFTLTNNKKGKFKDINFNLNDKRIKQNDNAIIDNAFKINSIQEKIKYINNLFKDIDESYNIYSERNSALEEYQNLFDLIYKENEKIIEYRDNYNKKNNENVVDLNVVSINAEKEMFQNGVFFDENIFKRFKDFEVNLARKLEQQASIGFRDPPALTKQFIDKNLNDVKKSFDKYLENVRQLEEKNKQATIKNNRNGNKRSNSK